MGALTKFVRWYVHDFMNQRFAGFLSVFSLLAAPIGYAAISERPLFGFFEAFVGYGLFFFAQKALFQALYQKLVVQPHEPVKSRAADEPQLGVLARFLAWYIEVFENNGLGMTLLLSSPLVVPALYMNLSGRGWGGFFEALVGYGFVFWLWMKLTREAYDFLVMRPHEEAKIKAAEEQRRRDEENRRATEARERALQARRQQEEAYAQVLAVRKEKNSPARASGAAGFRRIYAARRLHRRGRSGRPAASLRPRASG